MWPTLAAQEAAEKSKLLLAAQQDAQALREQQALYVQQVSPGSAGHTCSLQAWALGAKLRASVR